MALRRYLLLISVGVVFALGLVMVFGTSSADVLDRSLKMGRHHALIRQVLYGIFGIIIASVAYSTGYRNLLKISPFLFVICSLLLLLVFVPGIGKTINGARRWIGIGPYTLQPSELIKIALPLFYIHRFFSKEWSISHFLRLMLLILIPLLLVFLEPDTGTTAIIVLAVLTLLFLTKVPMKYWALPTMVVVIIGGSIAFNMPYVKGRIAVYMNPELDLLGKGHQPHQAKIAAGSGGFFGRGIGRSIQKLNYLPEAQNDYIAAIYAEELGFVGVLSLLTLYMIIACLGFGIAHEAADREGFCLAATLTFLISIQVFFNLGVVSGLLPSTGLNLPLFSQGGTSLMVNIIIIALLLNVAKESEKTRQHVIKIKSNS